MPDPAVPSRERAERIERRPVQGVRSLVHMALAIDPARPLTDSAPLKQPTQKARLDRRVRSCPVRVPHGDWEKVVVGVKTMYRTYAQSHRDRFARLIPEGEELPRPAIIYSQTGHARLYDTRLAVITAYRQEPLGAISREDLVREGFGPPRDIRHFRKYWRYRYARWGWRPGDLISVVELRPWRPEDAVDQARWLIEQLYGEWLYP